MAINRTTTTNVIATINRLGGIVPKKAAAEWDKLNALHDKATDLDLVDDLAGAVLAVLETDGDLSSDPAVQRAVTARAVRDLQPALAAELDKRVDAFSATHGDDLVEALREPFDKAAATITECLGKLGGVELDDSATTLRKGGDAAEVWVTAQAANKTITDIATTVKLMSRWPLDARYQVLIIADVEPGRFLADQLTGAKFTPWEAARAGYTLSFATPAIVNERRDAIVAEGQQREANAEDEFGRAYRRTRGDGATVLT